MDLEPIAWAIGIVGVAWALAYVLRNGLSAEFRDPTEKGHNPPPKTFRGPTKHPVPPRGKTMDRW